MLTELITPIQSATAGPQEFREVPEFTPDMLLQLHRDLIEHAETNDSDRENALDAAQILRGVIRNMHTAGATPIDVVASAGTSAHFTVINVVEALRLDPGLYPERVKTHLSLARGWAADVSIRVETATPKAAAHWPLDPWGPETC